MTGFTQVAAALVLDASFAIEALQGDARALEALELHTAADGPKLVPAHFWLETANALVRTRPSESMVIADLRILAEAGVEAADRGMAGLVDTIGLARKHGLTTYDAAYLQLALDVEGELGTFDKALARAAATEGVVVRP